MPSPARRLYTLRCYTSVARYALLLEDARKAMSSSEKIYGERRRM